MLLVGVAEIDDVICMGSLVLFVKPEGRATMLVSEVLVFMFVHNRKIRYQRGISS